MSPFCSHTCQRCGGKVSHYLVGCRVPEIIQDSGFPIHPDCFPDGYYDDGRRGGGE